VGKEEEGTGAGGSGGRGRTEGTALAACARISPRREGGEGWGKAALGQNQNGGTEVPGWVARLGREKLRPRQTGARGRAWAAGKEKWPCIRQRRQAGLGAMHMEMEWSTRAVPSDGSSGTSRAGRHAFTCDGVRSRR